MFIKDVLGIPQNSLDVGSETHWATHKPTPIEWNAATDWVRYGSLFASVNRMRKGTDFASHALVEKQVQHVTYQGDIEDDLSDVQVYGVNSDFDIYVLDPVLFPRPVDRFTPSGSANDHVLYAHGLVPSSAGYNDIHPDATLLDWIKYREMTFPDLPVKFNRPGWLYNRFSLDYYVQNFTNNSFVDGGMTAIRCSYDWCIRQQAFFGGFIKTSWTVWRVNIDFDVYFLPFYGTNNPSGTNYISPSTVHLDNNSLITVVSSTWTGNGQSGTLNPIVTTSYDAHVARHVGSVDRPAVYAWTVAKHQPAEVGISNLESFQRRGTDFWTDRHLAFNNFCYSMYDAAKGIRPSSFLSASDGLSSSLEVLSANHLENLLSLTKVAQAFPDVKSIARVVARIAKGDVSAIPLLVDVITDHILKLRFAAEPASVDVREILTTDIDAALERLLKVSWFTLYGSFSYDFTQDENSWGPGQLSLVTRSKCRVRLDMTTSMAAFLTLNGLGLAPTLSRIWDNVPFSFVVDWFTNMDDRLEAVDNQLLWLCVYTLFCVHSYTLTYTPSEEELDLYGLVQTPTGQPFRLQWYRRDFTQLPPRLTDSRFNLLSGSGGPRPETVGSFMYQLGT
jgi:hypothetical protein